MARLVCRGSSTGGKPAGRRVAKRGARVLFCLALAHPLAAQEPPPPAPGDGGSQAADVSLRGEVIPTGFQQEKYSAMLQIAVDGSPLPGASWDLEASFASREGAPKEFSGRVAVARPEAPVVLEFPVEFRPGSYVLALTARETTAGQSGTRRLEGRWPDPDEHYATVSPVVLLQPAEGAFVRGTNARAQGALALGETDTVRTELPTAVVSVVCRAASIVESVRVERRLEGGGSAAFDTIRLLPRQDRCAQVRDIIQAGTLRQGHFRYEVHLVTEAGEIGSGAREFDTTSGPGS